MYACLDKELRLLLRILSNIFLRTTRIMRHLKDIRVGARLPNRKSNNLVLWPGARLGLSSSSSSEADSLNSLKLGHSVCSRFSKQYFDI